MNAWQGAAALLCVVTGSLFDAQHRPVASAKVHLLLAGKKQGLTSQTDSAGIYRFTVPGGSYTLRAESGGNGEAAAGPFTVEPKKVTTIDLIIQPQFFDEPTFTVAGVTDNTYRGGHGADSVLRSAETLSKATASLSSGGEPHHNIAETYERSGHPLEAVREFQRAAESNPSEINLFDWGTELLSHRAPLPAAEVFTKGVRLFPQSLRLQLGLATAWYAAGSYGKAAQGFFKAADLDPNDPNPYAFLSKVQSREITQSAGYHERLARFAKLQPQNALANYYYAVSLGNLHRDVEARALLEKAVEIDPHLGPAYLQLGIIDTRRANYAGAIGDYQKALAANPELVEAHYHLAEAYRLSGDQMKTKQELAVYKHLSQESEEKVERERREIQRFVVALRSQSPQ